MISEYNKQNEDRLTTDWSLEPFLQMSGVDQECSAKCGRFGYKSKGEDALRTCGLDSDCYRCSWSPTACPAVDLECSGLPRGVASHGLGLT
jgi:hypothetical protein